MVVASLDRLGVKAALVGSLLVGVAGGTSNFLRRSFVGCTLHVGMAFDAGEHAAVDGILEGLRIDVQADGLAVDFMSQRGIAVTGKTFIGGRLLRSLRGRRKTHGQK